MEAVKVAIIDNGINVNYWSEKQPVRTYQYRQGEIVPSGFHTDESGIHGTICAYVFTQCAKNYELYSIDIGNSDDKEGHATVEKLIAAFQWCISQRISLIHLSMGTTNYMYQEQLKKAAEEVSEQGGIMVAAASNQQIITYPASLNHVIGVKCSKFHTVPVGQYVYCNNSMDGINIIASSQYDSYKMIGKNGKEIELYQTNSYTAPYISALVCNMLSQGGHEFPSICTKLRQCAYQIENDSINPLIPEYCAWNELFPLGSNTKLDVSVPNIVIYGSEMESLRLLAGKLNSLFCEEEYNCVTMDPYQCEFDREKHYYGIRDDECFNNISEKIRFLYLYTAPDLMITLSCNESDILELNKYEYIDIILADQILQLENGLSEQTVSIDADSMQELDVLKLYEKCKEMLQ